MWKILKTENMDDCGRRAFSHSLWRARIYQILLTVAVDSESQVNTYHTTVTQLQRRTQCIHSVGRELVNTGIPKGTLRVTRRGVLTKRVCGRSSPSQRNVTLASTITSRNVEWIALWVEECQSNRCEMCCPLPGYAIRGSTIHLPGGKQLHGNGPGSRGRHLRPFRHFWPRRPTRRTQHLCFTALCGSQTTRATINDREEHGSSWEASPPIPDSIVAPRPPVRDQPEWKLLRWNRRGTCRDISQVRYEIISIITYM